MKVKILTDAGEVLATLDMEPKEFSTGSRGFRTQGKLPYNGHRYQLNFMAVEIGSKPK